MRYEREERGNIILDKLGNNKKYIFLPLFPHSRKNVKKKTVSGLREKIYETIC
jgi:hypothetical protein